MAKLYPYMSAAVITKIMEKRATALQQSRKAFPDRRFNLFFLTDNLVLNDLLIPYHPQKIAKMFNIRRLRKKLPPAFAGAGSGKARKS